MPLEPRLLAPTLMDAPAGAMLFMFQRGLSAGASQVVTAVLRAEP